MNDFLHTLCKQKNLITEFDVELWYSLVDYGIVYYRNNVRFTFKDGTEIKV
jgi:site-specific DNA recombinase